MPRPRMAAWPDHSAAARIAAPRAAAQWPRSCASTSMLCHADLCDFAGLLALCIQVTRCAQLPHGHPFMAEGSPSIFSLACSEEMI